ncbi:MAG: hypothetical protein Q8O55_12950 [Dehalococcoidales bacterium]|nr:hypothetical protein [Dehalococcoidales bacterium]
MPQGFAIIIGSGILFVLTGLASTASLLDAGDNRMGTVNLPDNNTLRIPKVPAF